MQFYDLPIFSRLFWIKIDYTYHTIQVCIVISIPKELIQLS